MEASSDLVVRCTKCKHETSDTSCITNLFGMPVITCPDCHTLTNLEVVQGEFIKADDEGCGCIRKEST